MKIFIDDAGGFNWAKKGVSLFCAVTIPDRKFEALTDRFSRWRRSIIGHSKRELKGSELTEAQLTSFANKVFPGSDRDIWLTVQAVDTTQTKKIIIEKMREQTSVMLGRCSEISGEDGNSRQQEQYRQMSGWVKSRSPENVLWVNCLFHGILNSLQHTIVGFMNTEDDGEFDDLRIFIDQSFIKRKEHHIFWIEWLRAELTTFSDIHPLRLPHQWRQRSHPFLTNYSLYPGILGFGKLFAQNTGFFDSKKLEGLQIADICAHALFRYHRGAGAREVYSRLRQRIACEGGKEMNMLLFNESSLHKDDPRNHVGVFDMEEKKRLADKRREGVNSKS